MNNYKKSNNSSGSVFEQVSKYVFLLTAYNKSTKFRKEVR